MEVEARDGSGWKWKRAMEECNGSATYNGRVQWKWTVQWKSAMEVDRTMEECNGSDRTMEECNGNEAPGKLK